MIAKIAGAPLYVVHVSAKQAVEQIAAARDRGANVFAETCPQYLYLWLEEQLRPRPRSGAARGRGVGLLDAAASHAPRATRTPSGRACGPTTSGGLHRPLSLLHEGPEGDGPAATSPRSPTASARSSTGMDLLYQGVVAGEITLARWVELASTTPARMFGLYPKKGVIAPGADADIVIYDPAGHDRHRRRQDPPHEHGPLGLRGHTRSTVRSTPCCRAVAVIVENNGVHRRGRTRAVPATRPLVST